MPYKDRQCSVCQRPYRPRTPRTIDTCGSCLSAERKILLGPQEPDVAEMARGGTGQNIPDIARNLRFINPPLRQPQGRDFKFSDKLIEDNLVSPLRVCVLDIEATGLDASFGRVLCAVAQFYGPNELKVWRADQYKDWREGRRSDDRELVADVLAGVEEADVVIAHNGTNYDMPFLRTRAIIHGLPAVNPTKIVDPVMLARRTFRFHSNSLDSIASLVNTDFRKTRVEPKYWVMAYGDGDQESLDFIVEHCILDVGVLAEVAWKMRKYIRQVDAIGSWRA